MTTPGSADTTTSTGTSSAEPATGGTSIPQDAAAVDNGPDAVGPSSVHVPGQAPGLSILAGPASMTIGGSKPSGRGGTRKRSS